VVPTGLGTDRRKRHRRERSPESVTIQDQGALVAKGEALGDRDIAGRRPGDCLDIFLHRGHHEVGSVLEGGTLAGGMRSGGSEVLEARTVDGRRPVRRHGGPPVAQAGWREQGNRMPRPEGRPGRPGTSEGDPQRASRNDQSTSQLHAGTVAPTRYGKLCHVPPPYDATLFLQMLGIEIPMDQPDPEARLTVTHALIAGTGFLWAPVVMALADALCAFGVREHWPEGATGFTTIECKANFLSSAREGEVVIGHASPLHVGRSTQVWDATVTNETTERRMASYRCTQLMLYP